MAGILPRTALAAATLALLATSGAMAIEEPRDVTEIVEAVVPVVDSPAKASMSHARGGLNAAVADLASLSTVRASGAPGREASLGAVQASEAHPEFRAFVEKHKGAGHDYCPESAPGQPCAEALRRCALAPSPAREIPTPRKSARASSVFFVFSSAPASRPRASAPADDP